MKAPFLPSLAVSALALSGVAAAGPLNLTPIGTYESGVFDESAAEIVDFHAPSKRLFVVNADSDVIDVLDASDPTNPTFLFNIPVNGGPNSVAVNPRSRRGEIAVAVAAPTKTDPGSVEFYDVDGNFLNSVQVGALPDMLTYDRFGSVLVVANEGEPNDDYTIDPEGSVSIISTRKRASQLTQSDVSTVDFQSLNGLSLPGVRIFGPGATVAQDLEPEYIALDPFGRTAYVTCQENNAVAVIDVRRRQLKGLVPLGTRDHLLAGNGIDASNRDDAIHIQNWPVKGFLMPDAIAGFVSWEGFHLITADEGDSRDYDGYSEEERIEDITLDPAIFPNAAFLQDEVNLGRLKITTANGNTDGDSEFEELYSYGSRGVTIWKPGKERVNGQTVSFLTEVTHTGDEFEQITAALIPDDFNSTNDENDSFDNRSDDKGPEPEGVTTAWIGGRVYAFIGLERVGGIMIYDVTRPDRRGAQFVNYVNNRDFSGDAELGTAGDLGPEGLHYISRWDSPIRKPLLAVGNEVSGTTTLFRIDR